MCVPWFMIFSTLRFACGQIPESVNIPYNQAFLEEGGLAPSAAANTVISFKGRVIIVVGNRNNYPAKVGKGLLQYTAWYIICSCILSFVTFYEHNRCAFTKICMNNNRTRLSTNQRVCTPDTNQSQLTSIVHGCVWREKHFLFWSVFFTYFRFLKVGI